MGFPGGAVVKNLPDNAGDICEFNPWVGKIPWIIPGVDASRGWQPTPVFFARKIPWTEDSGGL